MKTLNDFKNEVAKEAAFGYESWEDMKDNLSGGFISRDLIEERLSIASERYAEYMAIEFAEWCECSKEAYDFWRKNKSYPTMDGSHNEQNSKKRKELYDLFRSNKH